MLEIFQPRYNYVDIFKYFFWCKLILLPLFNFVALPAGRYQCTVKIWIWLNPKKVLKRSFLKVGKICPIFHWRQFSQKLFDKKFSSYA